MNPKLDLLKPYPFEKLAGLKSQCNPPSSLRHIALSIGEPKHQPPSFVVETLAKNLDKLTVYAATKGSAELRQTITQWASKRFDLKPDTLHADQHILPVNGTREAIFAFTQAVIDSNNPGSVLMPNPFYQIYEGAAILAGAKQVFINCCEETGFLPDLSLIDEQTWQDCELLFICTPGNPTGATASCEQLQEIITLADRYDFIVACDECYSELYFDEAQPPAGLLQACDNMGRVGFERCVVFHSLSKRSNLPGLRSGFIAGDAVLIKKFLLYRTYHGSAMPLHTQYASIAAWNDEEHVQENRVLYREKFSAVCEILKGSLEFEMPDAGFYLWPKTPIDDVEFTKGLLETQNVTVLPGSFLARDTSTGNPGQGRIRMALVAPFDECIEAAHRIKAYTDSL
ncbi:MAG: N-succinyldiaminopimelate aminotransferase [Flavobacteriales bacterium]|jgi:N-succinyldiaminopimelate aminotransferase